jgi:hypothetical protein
MAGPAAHAKLSPSASTRWISCPASIRMEQHAPKGGDSIYAREGTTAHALGEIEASHTFGLTNRRQYLAARKAWRADFDAQGYDADQLLEMQAHVKDYVVLIADRLKRRPLSRVFLEQRLDTGVPTCWGTSDVVIVSPTHVEIIDLKYGAGLAVSAYGNSQLRLYGLGALDSYGDLLGDTDAVFMTVFQPRIDDGHVDTEELTPDELRAWRTDIVLPAAELALGEDAPFGPSESACRWCPAAGICTTRTEVALAEDFGTPYSEAPLSPASPEALTPEQLGMVLTRIPEIKAWCAAVEAHALEAAYTQGQHIPGWKVVRSGGQRRITDHAAAIQTLIDAGYKAEQVTDFKVKGIGVLEKLVGKKEFPVLLEGLIGKTEGKESLVPEEDKRTAITPAGQAAGDFEVVQGELI